MIKHQTIVRSYGKNGKGMLAVRLYTGGDLEGIVDCIHPLSSFRRLYYKWITQGSYEYFGSFVVGDSHNESLIAQLERFHIVPEFSKLREFNNYKRVKIKLTGIQFSTLILVT